MTAPVEAATDPSAAGRRPSELRGPLTVGVTLWLIFVARTTLTVNGHRYFTLFDDAMISMRYARNLAHGHGLVWNAGGAHVEGYTNFLWTLWMALLHLLPLPSSLYALAVMVTSVAVLFATVIVAHSIARELAPDRPSVAMISAWAVALYYPLAFWALRGMEVGIVSLLLLSAALLAIRTVRQPTTGSALLLGAVLVGAVLTRDDAAVPAIVILCYIALASRRDRLRNVGIPLALTLAAVLGHGLFRSWYYGDVLPNTYYLKISNNPLGGRLARGLTSMGADVLNELGVPLLLAGVALGRRRGWRRPELLLLAGCFASLCAYSVYVGGDAWEGFEYANRYICAGVPFLLLLAAVGVDELVRMPPALLLRLSRWLGAGCVVLAVFMAADLLPLARIQDAQPDRGTHGLRVVLLLVAAVTFLVLPRLRDGQGAPLRPAWISPTKMVAWVMVAAATAVPWAFWVRNNAKFAKDFDLGRVRYGLVQRQVTQPDAVIAVAVAGAMPYFSGRPAVDLLGKSDKVVAREKPRFSGFYPGHNKYDYAYSICQLRPDLVVELWNATSADRSLIKDCGYTRVRHDDVYVRDDSTKVNRAALEAALVVLEKQSPTDF